MENQDIPTVDFSKFTFEFPDTIPDEVHTIKGYLWSGQHAHSVRRGGHGGAVSYLFIISYDKETGKMRFYRCWEMAAKMPFGWKILTGKTDAGNKRKIELTGKVGSIFELVIDDGDH